MVDTTQLVSVDRLTSEEKGFLIQSLSELCSCYRAYLRGDYPEFIEMDFQTKVGNTQNRLEEILDSLVIDGGCLLYLEMEDFKNAQG